jgi:hypothetical protein
VRSFVALIAVVVASLLASACGDEKRLPTQPDGGGPPPETATFTRVQNEVFTPTCALAGCHLGPKQAANEGMVLEAGAAYANIVGIPSNQKAPMLRVKPNDPDNSYLVLKITPFTDINGARMPQSGFITDAQRKLVIDWVLRGAPND